MRETTRIGALKGGKVGVKGVDVKLLQFADDTVFFCQLKYQCILAIKAILHNFEVVSRLRVNFHKIHVRVGVTEVDLNIFLKCLNCGRMEFPFKYLGMRIGGNPRREEFWRPIIKRSNLGCLHGRVGHYPW